MNTKSEPILERSGSATLHAMQHSQCTREPDNQYAMQNKGWVPFKTCRFKFHEKNI